MAMEFEALMGTSPRKRRWALGWCRGLNSYVEDLAFQVKIFSRGLGRHSGLDEVMRVEAPTMGLAPSEKRQQRDPSFTLNGT